MLNQNLFPRNEFLPRAAQPARIVRRQVPPEEDEEIEQQRLAQVAPPAAAASAAPAPAPEQEDSGLVSSIASGALTAVGALGNVLDLPGSSVRDILSGRNPFDQWINPLSHYDKGLSATGRDLLETYGMRKNKETGWVPLADPGEFARDAAGFVAELALDPLAWMSGGLSKVAQKGMKEAGEAAAKSLGKTATKEAAEAASLSAGKKAKQAMGRGFRRAVDAYDKIDPGQAIGRKMYDAGIDEKFVAGVRTKAGEVAGKGFRRASPYVKGAQRWADQVDPFPSGGERQRFSTEARRTFGEEADEFMPVMDARARTWAKEAAERSPDEYFKDLSTKQSDIDNLPDEALRQAEAAAVETPAFKEWFGDSKVVDEAGKPLRVYHGTPQQGLEQFDLNEAREVEGGIFFSSRADVAEGYRVGREWDSPNVRYGVDEPLGDLVESYLSLKNPLEYKPQGDYPDLNAMDAFEMDNAIKMAKSKGHDGLIIRGIDDSAAVTGEIGDVYIAFDPTQIKSVNNRGTFDPSNPNILFHPAYHGSPHRFDEFSLHKIGSGEGAQAYGWGLYFTDTKAIAERYKRSLTRDRRISDADLREYFTPGRKVSGYSGEDIVEKFDWNDGDWSVTVRGVERGPGGTGTRLRRHATYPTDDNFEKTMGRKPDKGGALYEVDLAPKQDEYLLWDEPLSKQSKKVREALADEIELEIQSSLGDLGPGDKLEDVSGADLYLRMQSGDMTPEAIHRLLDSTPGVEGRIDKGAIVDNLYDAIGNQRLTPDDIEETLKYLFDEYIPEAIRTNDPAERSVIINSLTDTFRGAVKNQISPEELSRTLKKKGVRGIKYLDGISRGKSKGSYNYVVFDDSDVTIQNVFRQEGAAGAPRGAVVFKDSKRVIHAFKSADISTLAHESAHVFRRDLSEELQAAAESAIDKMIDGNVRGADGNWTREAEEAFASGFERYLRDGTAPSEQLKSTFEKFKEWLTGIYQNIVGTPLEKNVSPELRSVFDSMLQSGESAGRIQRAGGKAVHLASDAIRRVPDMAGKAGRGFKRNFNTQYKGLREATTQDAMIDVFDPTMAVELNETILPIHQAMDGVLAAREGGEGFDRLKEFNVLSDRVGDYLSLKNPKEGARRLQEYLGDDAEFQQVAEALDPVTSMLKTLHEKLTTEGVILDELDDTIVNYIPRKLRESVKAWENQQIKNTGGSRASEFSVSDPEYQASRKDLLRDVEQSALDELARDAVFAERLENINTLSNTFGETGGVADPAAVQAAKADAAKYAESFLEGRGDPNTRVVKKGMMMFVDDDGNVFPIPVREGRKLGRTEQDQFFKKGDDVQTLDPAGNAIESGKVTDWSGDAEEGFKYTVEDTKSGQETIFEASPDTGSDTRPLDRLQPTHPSQYTYLHPTKKIPIRPQTEKRAPKIVDYYSNHPAINEGGLYEPVLQGIVSGVAAMHGTHQNARFLNKIFSEAPTTGILKQVSPDQSRIEIVGTPLKDMLDTPGMKKFDKNKLYRRMAETNEWKAKVKADRGITKDTLKGTIDGETITEIDTVEHFLFGDVKPNKPKRLTNEAKKYFDNLRVDKAIADDIIGLNAMTTPSPIKGNPLKSLTALWKKSVLTHPARYTRDTSSGQIQNMTHGIFSGQSLAEAGRIVGMPLMGRFKTSDKLKQAPAVVEYMQKRGLDDVDQAVAELYAIHKGHAANIYKEMDTVDDSISLASFDRMSEAQPGVKGGFKAAFDRARAMDGATWWNPLKLQGVGKETETTNIIWNMGDVVGKMADDFNRLTGFVELLKRGENPLDAMAEVNRVQLNYDPKSFTPLERQLKAYLPFYSFFSRETAYVANELATNPSGRLGKLIRLQAKGSRRTENEEGDYIPDHVRTQMSIPIGKSADGGTNYFTGFGLMHDDPVEKLMTLAIDPGDGARKGLSMLNPLPKGIIEHATGRSTFQGGPLGGRDLVDQDPTIGRILTNFGLQEKTPGGRAAPVLGQRWLEEVAANSPASRILSNIRTATDSRKAAWQKMLNIGTGYRVTTVSPQHSRAALRELSDSILREAGARKFSTYTPPTDDQLAEIEKTNPESAQRLRAIRRNRELVNQERRSTIRRNEMAAVMQSIQSGQVPAMNKTQQQRYDRWLKTFGTGTNPEDWTQYVYQRSQDGSPRRTGIDDWKNRR